MINNKKYQIVYADPPWDYGNRMFSSNKNDSQRAITRAYETMKVEDITKLPIKNIINNDSVCFMWTTDAYIPCAIEIMTAWGFKYKTIAFTWIKKEKSGKQVCYMGQWTMKGCEIVLLGTRGRMTQYLKSRKVRQLQSAIRDRKKHSQKPQIIRDKIVEMFGDKLAKIELFAREKYEGWDVWGNEVESNIELKI